jgi:hypothetical protein
VIYTSSVEVPAELHDSADGCLVSLEPDVLIETVKRALDHRPPVKPQVSVEAAGIAGRSSPLEIAAQARAFESGMLRDVLDHAAACLVILNRNREIVFYNRAARQLAGAANPPALGLRLGEAFSCAHATAPGGCGAAEPCRSCGAVPGTGASAGETWHIVRARGVEGPGELSVSASPLEGREGFVVCTLADVSGEARRQAMDRIFFHDILNAAAAVKGCANMMRDDLAEGADRELADLVCRCAAELVPELRGHQLLLQAEDARLTLKTKVVGTLELIGTLASEFRNYAKSKDRTILIDPLSEQLRLETDPIILSRALGNMLNSAVAATPSGGTVLIGCRAAHAGIEFWVHGSGRIPLVSQPENLPRTLSAGDGSLGLSIYSMRLLTEHLLGTVRCEVGQHGTRFSAHCPLSIAVEAIGAVEQPVPA